jgi:hypothetical protein
MSSCRRSWYGGAARGTSAIAAPRFEVGASIPSAPPPDAQRADGGTIAFVLAPLRLERLRWRRCNRPDPGCASGGRALEVAQIDARVPRKRHRRRFRVRAPAIVGTLAKRLDAPSWRLRLELHESAREPAWEGGGVSGSRHRAVAHGQYAGRPYQRGSSGAGDRSSVPGEGSSRALTQEPVSEPVCRATVVTVPGRFRSLTSDGQRQPTARPLPPAVSDESADLPPMLQAVLSRQVHTKRTGRADSETSQTSRVRTRRRQWANATEWFRSLLPQASSQGATTWSWQSRSRNSVTSSRSMPWLSKSVPSADCVHAQAPWWRRRQSLARSLVPRRTTARWMSGRSWL